MKLFQTIPLLILSVLFVNTAIGQNTKIETTNLEIKNNTLIIEYSFEKSKKNQKFNVWVEITTSTGKFLELKSLSGDVGNNVIAGENKKIVWDYEKDGIVLNEDIDVQVFGDIIKSSGGNSGKAVLLSALVPGLGLSSIEKGKPYWLMGVATYGALGASILINNQAASDYDAYLLEKSSDLSESLFSDSEKKKNLSKTMAFSAAGIWAASMVWTIVKAKKAGVSTASIYNKRKLLFYTGIDPRTKTAGFNLKYRF